RRQESTTTRHEDQLVRKLFRGCAADKNMKEAATEVRTKTKTSTCVIGRQCLAAAP
ncbi:hypothetical protein AVEN_81937-1, partial [Araneus ventricosus]